MYFLSNIVRFAGDPKIIRSGPSLRTRTDRLAQALGWFSIALGAIELFAPSRVTRPLGMRGRETLVRAYGLRELSSGIMSLSVDKQAGLWSRVAGDGMDIVTLLSELRTDNPRKANVGLALLMVGGIALLDYMGAQDLAAQGSARLGRRRLYSDRSGFPKGIEAARTSARRLTSRGEAALTAS
ncbi:MAG TPA: hypothetical protein VKY22_07930 [Bradyrhizobium sp.]|nr:hypothetical protein [Bradyrhizobium sp.]